MILLLCVLLCPLSSMLGYEFKGDLQMIFRMFTWVVHKSIMLHTSQIWGIYYGLDKK